MIWFPVSLVGVMFLFSLSSNDFIKAFVVALVISFLGVEIGK